MCAAIIEALADVKTMKLELSLSTAGGEITCPRCTARSSRTGQQCGRPALKRSTSQKCQFHGGRSTGPKTAEGKARIAALHTVHGQETRVKRADRSAASARLSQLEDAAYLLGMMTGPRGRGRKASGYVPVKTLEDATRLMLDNCLRRIEGSSRARS
jgi:hypothetical protein